MSVADTSSARTPSRVLALVATLALAMSLLPFAGTAHAQPEARGIDNACEFVEDFPGFPDIGGFAQPTQDAIECLGAYEITVGYTDGTYRPGLDVQRYQMALFLSRVIQYAVDTGSVDAPDDVPDAGFEDTDDLSAEAQAAINLLAELDITTGTSATEFSPNETVNRRDMASFIYRLQDVIEEDSYATDASDIFPDVPDTMARSEHINALAEQGIVQGAVDGNYYPFDNVRRAEMALFIMRHIDENVEAGRLPALVDPVDPGQPQATYTDAPELEFVERDGDIVTFAFDETVTGKALDFDGVVDPEGDPVEGTGLYTGLRLYDAEGTAYYAHEAGIFGDEVRARFESETVVAAAVRAGVYENTVQDVTGLSNPAGDFPLAATAVEPDPIPEFYPQLVSVGNYRTDDLAPPEILVDYAVDLNDEDEADFFADVMNALGPDDADVFALVGNAGQVYRADDIHEAEADGTVVTVTVNMDDALEDVPEAQLERGFIEFEDVVDNNNGGPSVAQVDEPRFILSEAWEGRDQPNGSTTDPDLVSVEPGPAPNQLSYEFDEAVSAELDDLDNEQFWVGTNQYDFNHAEEVARSIVAADEARVVVATFDEDDFVNEAGHDDQATVAWVTVNWEDDTDRTVVDTGAAQATDQTGSQQGGWNTPAEVLVTPVQPEVPDDPTPGVTDIPDLQSVERDQNEITGNWSITFTFDHPGEDIQLVPDDLIDFSLYNEAGVRFSSVSRNVQWGADVGETVNGERVFTFGPDAGDATFSNEQIEAAVLGTVQDSAAGLDWDAFDTQAAPLITEGHDGVE